MPVPRLAAGAHPCAAPALTLQVHRGVYETAVLLYDRFLPLVQDHLATSPFAKVRNAPPAACSVWVPRDGHACSCAGAALTGSVGQPPPLPRPTPCPIIKQPCRCFSSTDHAEVWHGQLTFCPARPARQVAFTGHSLGGSLGTVLMLMYVRRGVLPKSAISPVYT